MFAVPSSVILYTLAIAQVVGLASAFLTRFSEGSHCQGWCQSIFLACLGIVGLATMASLQLNVGGWYLSGTTLALMVVAATCDFRGDRSPTTVP